MTVINTPTIIGIGASAGGLEALEQFFSQIPVTCGAAFVVIQHLDPTQKGLLPELLQRVTPLNVTQVTDGMKVKPNWIYVIPPNKDLSILDGHLHLSAPIGAIVKSGVQGFDQAAAWLTVSISIPSLNGMPVITLAR